MSHKCDRCKKKATHIRVTTIRHHVPYGNPYHPPKYYEVSNTTTEYACETHFKESASKAICGPHRWRTLDGS